MRISWGRVVGALLVTLTVTMGVVAVEGVSAATRPPGSAGRQVYVTNILSNDVATFDIKSTGMLSRRDELTSAGGTPRSIVVTPDGRFAYAANGVIPMTTTDFNSISRYRITADGTLVPLEPPAVANGDPEALAVAPNGRMLYVVNRRTNTVLAFRIGVDGQLTRHGDPVPTGVEFARGIAMTPDGRFLFVSHGNPVGTQKQDLLTRFAVDDNGTLTPFAKRVQIGAAGGAMAVTPDGQFLYVPCSVTHEVFGFRIGPDGELTSVPGRRFDGFDVPIAAVATPDGRHLYVADGGLISSTSTLVSAYRIQTNGDLEHFANVNAGKAPVSLTPTPDGSHLYVANLNSSDVSGFRIGPNGQLQQIDGSPFPTGGHQPAFQSTVVSPNQGPAAAFTARPAAPGAPTTVDATASLDPDGRIARYDWDFGDGTGLPNGGPNPVHVYRNAGTFQVHLTVTDDEGCSTLFVYNGTSALCTGSPAAVAARTIVIPRN